MNLLFSLDNYDHATGGAEKSVRALAERLALRGHQVQVLQRGEGVGSYDHGPVRVHTRPLPSARLVRDRDRDTLRWNRAWRPMLDEFLDQHPTDLLLTQTRLLPSTVSAGESRGIPVVVFMRAFSMFCPLQFRSRDALTECDRGCRQCLPWGQRVKYGAIQRNLARYERGCRRASLLVANSRYMQAVIRRFYELDSVVVYPTTELDQYRTGDGNRESVLMAKPQHIKGLAIFLEVARRMPDTHFLVAGRASRHARAHLRRLDNVESLGWVDDMRTVYARTRVLLGPSIWPEPFGRVFVEAGASGIPSVASVRGGIPEAVGDGGILIDAIFDSDRWIEALRRLEDPATYSAYSAKARAHAKQFDAEASVQQFAEAVRNVVGIDL